MKKQKRNQADQVKKIQSIPIAVLMVGILMSVFSSFIIHDIETKQVAAQSSAEATNSIQIMKANVSDVFELIQSTSAFYASSEYVSRDEFKIFSGIRLLDHPSVHMLGWLPRIFLKERSQFEALVQREGLKGFHITEKNQYGSVSIAEVRNEYFPALYLEPTFKNNFLSGYDFLSNAEYARALYLARDSGTLQSTSREIHNGKFEIYVFQAVYQGGYVPTNIEQRRKKLCGYILGILRVSDMIGVRSWDHTDSHFQSNMVFDMSAEKAQQRLFPEESTYQTINDLDLEVCMVTPTQVAGRLWHIVHCESAYYSQYLSQHSISSMVLLAALFLTFFLAAYLWSLSKKRMFEYQLMQQIQQSENHLKKIMASVGDVIITSDNSGLILSLNNAALTTFGYKAEDLLGQPMNKLMPFSHGDGEEISERYLLNAGAQRVVGGKYLETIACRKGGATFPVELSLSHVEESQPWTSITLIRDISMVKKLEMLQSASNQRMDRFFKVTIEGLFFHQGGMITDVNASGAAMVGMLPQDIIGHDLLSFVSSDYVLSTTIHLNRYDDMAWESAIVSVDGTVLSVEMQGKRVDYDDAGIRVLAVRDMTQRKQAEQRVEKIAAELRQFIDTASTLIFGVDISMNITEWNHSAEQLSNHTKEAVLGCNLENVFTNEEGEDVVSEVMKKVLYGHEVLNIELSFYTKNNHEVDILLSASPRYNDQGDIIGAVGVGQDMTALNLSKAQTIQASKLAILGEMTTSVAHELNQPLNVMRMALGNCRRKLESGKDDLDYYLSKVNRVDNQVTRMANIVDHMRMFGRKASESFVVLDLRAAVNSAFDLMSEQLRLADVVTFKDYCSEKPSVLGHQIQVEQVILNLISNARDAMNTHCVDEQKRLYIKVKCAKKVSSIIIEDTGGGLPKGKINRVFEPFFTTKEPGEGTGLGLSVSYGIIEDMGGTIVAANTPEGARFIITLPTVEVAEESLEDQEC